MTDVGCAVIERNGEILLAQRKPGDSYAGYWEFPGGKIRSGETVEACLVREAREELGMDIRPRRLLMTKNIAQSGRVIQLFFYFCDAGINRPVPIDCFAFRWVPVERLRSQMLLPGDFDMMEKLVCQGTFCLSRSTPVACEQPERQKS
jgi:mutator protein MutT